MDQILNHASKFRWVYNENVSVPIVVRTPMGGRRGYGPTHSQSLEKLFMGIPGLRVVAPNTIADPALLIETAIADDDPVIFVEHKLLYASHLLEKGSGDLVDAKIEQFGSKYPAYKMHFSNKPQITIATYSYNFEIVRKVALEVLYEREIFSDIILYTQLSPFDLDPLMASIAQSQRLLTVEEGTLSLGWGSELLARISESGIDKIKNKRVGALDFPIANAKSLEDKILPSHQVIKQAIYELLE